MSTTSLTARARLPAVSLPRARGVVSDRALAAVLALTLLAAALRFWRIGHQGFWFDEANSALLVHYSLGKMLGLLPHYESTPPLYYIGAWFWSRVFGSAEAGLRSFSAVVGVATVPVAYAAAKRLVSRRAGVAAAALTACNPLLVWYSQEARSYELLVLLCGVELWAFAAVLEEPTRRRLGIWAATSVLALLTHYYAVLAVAPQGAWLLLAWRRVPAIRLRAIAAVAVAAICGLALVPLAVTQASTHHDAWIGSAPLSLRLGQIVPQFLIGPGAPARTLLKFLGFALAMGALALLALRADARARRAVRIPLVLAPVGLLLSLVFVAGGSDSLITRNLLALWLPAAIAVAAGCAARPRGLGVVLATALCAIGVTASVGVALDRDLQRPDWRGVAAVLGRRPVNGSRVILVQHYRTLLPLSLYLPGLRALRRHAASGVRELDVIAARSPDHPFCWWGSACNLIPSSLQPSYEVPGFHELWVRHAFQFSIMRLVADHPVDVNRRQVARALTETTLSRDALMLQR